MDKHKISRRRLLGLAAATATLLVLPPWKASPVERQDGGVPPGLTPDVLGQYLAGLGYVPAERDAAAMSGMGSWVLEPSGSPEGASVICAVDNLGSVVRVEASAGGFSLGRLLEDLARIPFANADGREASRWMRGVYEGGFERWPGTSRSQYAGNGARYEVTGSFNSNGYLAVLIVERQT